MTGRFTVKQNGGLFFIIVEKKLQRLNDFLEQRWLDDVRMVHPVYLHGIQGVGKSHCLYYTAWQMSQDSSYRVAYIPDCGGITMAPFSNILQVTGLAFFFFFFWRLISLSLGN